MDTWDRTGIRMGTGRWMGWDADGQGSMDGDSRVGLGWTGTKRGWSVGTDWEHWARDTQAWSSGTRDAWIGSTGSKLGSLEIGSHPCTEQRGQIGSDVDKGMPILGAL